LRPGLTERYDSCALTPEQALAPVAPGKWSPRQIVAHLADFERAAHHPERGDLTLRTLLETMAGHDLNHLIQLQRLSV
jgi:hypothetical protein